MKFSVSTYSFHKYIQEGILNQFTCIAKVKEMGFDAIEFTDLTPPEGVSEIEFAHQLRAECDRLNLPVANHTVAADLLNNTDGGKAEVERLKKKIDIAEILGAPGLRHDAAWGFKGDNLRNSRGVKNVVGQLADCCREITEYAASKGIHTMVENHGQFLQDADRVELLINTVNHPNFGWLCDMGNFLCADESPVLAYGKAAPYAFHAHAKDFILKSGSESDPGEAFFQTRAGNYLRGTIIGHGVVPVKQCMQILKNNDYKGYISIEFEGIEDNLMALRIGLDNLHRYAKEVWGE